MGEGEIEAVVGKLRVGERQSRRWPLEELVNTGTDGSGQGVAGRPVMVRVAEQLRLIK